MNATTDLVPVPAVSGTGRPNYVALNGRVHRATCKRRGTYKGGAAPMIGSAPMMARLEGVKPATCCKPERAADWKAAVESATSPAAEVMAGILANSPDLAAATAAHEEKRTEKAKRRGLVLVTEPTTAPEPVPADVPVETPAEPGERVDTTERMVTLVKVDGGVKVRALYVARYYRGDAKKPYRGTWVLESNGATIDGGPTIGYTVNGEDAGKGPLGIVAAKAALRA